MRPAKKKFFDILAIFFLVAHLFFLIINWQRYPTELDTPYHLLMGKMFAEKGGIPSWDDYEFAPMGRPHLYPPLEHLMIAAIHKATQSAYMDIGRSIVIAQAFLGLFMVWFFARKFFNAGIAFFALIFFASNTEMWWWQTSVAPMAFLPILYPAFLYLFYKKRVFSPAVILTACIYLHYGLFTIIILSVAIAVFSEKIYIRRYVRNLFVIFISAVVLASPWLLHIYKFRQYFFKQTTFIKTLDLFSLRIAFHEIFLHLNLLLWIFLLCGLFFCYKNIKKDFKYSLILSGFFSSFIFLFLFNGVRFNAHSPVITSVFAGIGFYLVFLRAARLNNFIVRLFCRLGLIILIFVTVFLELHFVTPHLLSINKYNARFMGLKKEEVYFRPSLLTNEIVSFVSNAPLRGKHAIRVQHFFTEKDTFDLLDYISVFMPQGVILHVYDGALANYITLQTGMRTDWGMFFEIVSPELLLTIGQNLRHGYYLSTDKYFKELLPKEYLKIGKYPEIIKKIGKFYIGYIRRDE